EIIESFKMVERDKEKLAEELKQEKQRAEQEKQRTEQEIQRAEQKQRELEQEKQRAEQEKQRAEQKEKELEQEKQRAEQEKVSMIREMLKQGMNKEIVMQIAKVDELFLKKYNLI
ncbi:MAG: hypothetical protein NZ455_15140, partial [Bacteroidia bacterium]|nr:hypothetical protein [Bacteroidia bacterium]